VNIKMIEEAIADRAFAEGWVVAEPRPCAPESASPWSARARASPLAAQLNKAGHEVTVFERADRIGGLLNVAGIPT